MKETHYKADKWEGKIQWAKIGLENGEIKIWRDLFARLSKTAVANICGIQFSTIINRLNNPENFTILEVETMAKKLNVDFDCMLKFILTQIQKKRSSIDKIK